MEVEEINEEKTESRSKSSGRKGISMILIGTVIVLLEAGISYVLVTRFLVPKKSTEVYADAETSEESVEMREEIPAGNQGADQQEPAQSVPQNRDSDLTRIKGVFTLDDLVVNPAHSRGKHFFVATVVFTFENKKMVELITEREPMLRDRIIDLLCQKTFEWMSRYENREKIRAGILNITKELLQCQEGINIYFTKYVLQ